MSTIYRLYHNRWNNAYYLSHTADSGTYETDDSIAIRPHRDDYSTFHYARHRDLYSRNPMSFHLIDTYTPPAEAAPPPSTTYRLYRGKGSGSWYVSRDVNGIVRETSKSTRHRPERQDYPTLVYDATKRELGSILFELIDTYTVPEPATVTYRLLRSNVSDNYYVARSENGNHHTSWAMRDEPDRIRLNAYITPLPQPRLNILIAAGIYKVLSEQTVPAPVDDDETPPTSSNPSAAPSTEGYRLEATAKDWFVRDGYIVIGQIPLPPHQYAAYFPELWTQHGNRNIGQFATLDQAAQALYDLAKRLTT